MHVHRWCLEYYERGISRGECACGARQFFADSVDMETFKRIGKLNKTHGKEGNVATKEHFEDVPIEEQAAAAGLPPVPTRPRGKIAAKQYYAQNKEQILAEIRDYGTQLTKRRWGIPGSTMVSLKRRWGLPVVSTKWKVRARAEKTSPEIDAPAGDPSRNGLPPFPIWNSNWQPEVQLAWIQAYKEMSIIGFRRT